MTNKRKCIILIIIAVLFISFLFFHLNCKKSTKIVMVSNLKKTEISETTENSKVSLTPPVLTSDIQTKIPIKIDPSLPSIGANGTVTQTGGVFYFKFGNAVTANQPSYKLLFLNNQQILNKSNAIVVVGKIDEQRKIIYVEDIY